MKHNLPSVLIKRQLRRLIPGGVYRRAAALCHLPGRLAWSVRVAWERGRPREMYYFGLAPGDDLLCTAVLRELAARQRKHVWMMSNHPQLFAGNADVAQVVPVDKRFHFYTNFRGGK